MIILYLYNTFSFINLVQSALNETMYKIIIIGNLRLHNLYIITEKQNYYT